MPSPIRRALTCLEVLVSIAVVALLVSAMLPALKCSADQTREQRENASAKAMTRALASYAIDNADQLVVAAPNWAWVHNYVGAAHYQMRPHDPFNSSRFLGGTIAKTFVPHLIDGRGIDPKELQVDPATYANFIARTTNPAYNDGPNTFDFASNSSQAAFLWQPSFGYNGVFVGGSYRHGAHSDAQFGLTNNAYGGAFYLQRMSQAINPAKLIAFAAARGGDVEVGSWWSYGQSYPNATPMRPGYWLVTPPRSGTPNTTAWSASNTFNANTQPQNWGNLDCRAGNSKATVAQLDGSNQTLTLEALRDMRRWANQATDPNWQWAPGRNAVP